MSKIKHIILLALLLAIDQAAKLLVKANLVDSQVVLIDGILKLIYHKNDGAVWGILSGKTAFITITTTMIFLGVVWFYFKLPKGRHYNYLRLITVFIIAGAVGNLIDRFAYGFVIDFIYFELINFPVFNFADCYITVSAFVMVLLSIFYYKDEDFSFLSRKKKTVTVNGQDSASQEDLEDSK